MEPILMIRMALLEALAGFANDPADSKFQEGYQAAINEMLREVDKILLDKPDN